ncbi:PREDICTED: uncharacterized protein LOC107329269 [Acropora digitifera]|uniref:uncharacterized protein LOC107329269 n=1 Tax=Acropora digitifera TaxID=70779 RepID=UPI00077AE191|nr:PREDICTED: uncharacterized protein LOC107329269 [Acropora digitifera]
MELQLMGSSRRKKVLKPDAIPTIFPHKPAKPGRLSSVKRAEKRQCLETLITLTEDSPRPSRARIEEEGEAAGNVDDNDSPGTVSEGAEAADEGDTLVLPYTIPERCEFSTQIEDKNGRCLNTMRRTANDGCPMPVSKRCQ